MIIEILVGITSFFAIISIEHFFLSLGFFSVWMFLVIYLYRKMHKTIGWIVLILSGLVIGVSFNLGLGTYLLSAGLSLFFLFLTTKFIPDDHFLTKYIPYFLTFLIFYLLRDIFGSFSSLSVFPVIHWSDIFGFSTCSFISTILVIVIDRIYSQVRSGDSSKKGIGIEIRRR